MKKVILATPPYHAGVVESAGIWPPLGLVYIAGELRKSGFDVEIYDSMSRQDTLDDVRMYLRSIQYDVIGVSAITASINAALDVFRISKEEHPEAKTVLGNVHGTFLYKEILDEHSSIVDFVVRGEGEVTMIALMEVLEKGGELNSVSGLAFLVDGKIKTTPVRKFVEDINTLEPAWDLLDWTLYKFFVMAHSRLGIVNSSRGCPHSCTFCSQQKFWERGYRELTADNFVSQLRTLRNSYDVNVVMLSDEYPTKNRDRWEKILDMLIEEDIDISLLLETRVEDIIRDRDILWKYRKAKILHIYVGVEATNQESLDVFKKDIKCTDSQEALRLIAAHGMISECSFVLGMPNETHESIARTLDLAKHYNADFSHFLAIAPWPYSDLYPDVKEYIIEKDYSKYNLITPIIKPLKMTLEEVNQAIINCYKEYYTWKVPVFRDEPNEFRRQYLLQSMRVMMRNSFLTKYMQGAHMPHDVDRYMDGSTNSGEHHSYHHTPINI
jgi:anaerobic magnesium-protoporphyrin IX monomethyl ester cyclase